MNRRGFTLIEVLIMITVLTIAVTPLALVLSQTLMNSGASETVDNSAYLLERQLESVLSQRYDLVVDAGPTAFAAPYGNYTYQIVVSAAPAGLQAGVCSADTTQCKQVQIIVDHSFYGSIDAYTLTANN
jgi:prepilin-type N-terminal cleavage/methylation domain-containing protein